MPRKFIVLEIQVSDTVGILTYAYDTENEALVKFHTILAAAAGSNLPKHTAMIIDEVGGVVRLECVEH